VRILFPGLKCLVSNFINIRKDAGFGMTHLFHPPVLCTAGLLAEYFGKWKLWAILEIIP
jgi:hypothetical protein